MYRAAIKKVLDIQMSKFQDILKQLLESCSTVSVTKDIWSDASMRGYIGLTAHYIVDGKLSSKVLGVPRFESKLKET